MNIKKSIKRRAVISYCARCVLIFLLPSCGGTQTTKLAIKPSETHMLKRCEAKWYDIPFPLNVDYDLSRCSVPDGGLNGTMAYKTHKPLEDSVKFYDNGMARLGWECVSSLNSKLSIENNVDDNTGQYASTVLVYQKPSKCAVIIMAPHFSEYLVSVHVMKKEVHDDI